ncbi:EpsG family protein [Nubsella zeaxanthinifaciens]|uniref:EpsG family protein n=1 Tax=Nubsella zeaxanthinifaciens TaxID=392412 RepID=UPI003D0336DB
MGIYHIIFFIIFISGFVSTFTKVNKYYSIVIFFILAIFGSLRYKIGMDYESYENIFNSISDDPTSIFNASGEVYVEPGYALVISCLKSIGLNNIGIFAFHILITLIFFYKAIIKYSVDSFLSWNIFYGVYYANLLFNGMRQGLFIAIILLVFPRLLKRDLNSFLKMLFLSVFLAFFVHKTALMLPIFYFFCLFEPKMKYKIYLLIFMLIWAFSGVGKILVEVGGLAFFKDTAYLSVVDFYTQSEAFGKELKFFSITVLHRIVILVLALYFSQFKSSSPLFRQLSNIYFWGAIIYLFLTPMGYILATRVSMNLKIFEVTLLPFFIPFLKESYFKLIGFLIISLWSFAVMLTNFYLPGNYPYYIPYRTILEK